MNVWVERGILVGVNVLSIYNFASNREQSFGVQPLNQNQSMSEVEAVRRQLGMTVRENGLTFRQDLEEKGGKLDERPIELGPSINYKVIPKEGLFVRKLPSTTAELVGALSPGDVIKGSGMLISGEEFGKVFTWIPVRQMDYEKAGIKSNEPFVYIACAEIANGEDSVFLEPTDPDRDGHSTIQEDPAISQEPISFQPSK